MFTIPVTNEAPFYSINVELEDLLYTFEFRYSEFLQIWFMSVADSTGTVIVSGVKLVTGFPLLYPFNDKRLPPGTIFAIDTQGQDADAVTQEALGQRIQIVYLTNAEALAL